ncbi:MAG: DNA/RNA nuclease SfsA [Candidatus Thermoplasmatota archaeon]|nr:DNA/RNA nuclease SfsA [Candidatus Thermoplasmatota archaeon]
MEPDSKGIFRERKNRFLAEVEISKTDSVKKVHVRDPGRLREILYDGNEVLVKKAEKEGRKTDWDLLAGKVKENWILVNSGYHRKLMEKILENHEVSPFGDIKSYQGEKQLRESRIDFLLIKDEKKIWVEVKGCTLAESKRALFPDAPTERGTRHVEELTQVIKKEEVSGAVIFLVFRPDAECFEPYEKRDPEFTSSLKRGIKQGLEVHPIKLSYDGEKIYHREKIPLCESFDPDGC